MTPKKPQKAAQTPKPTPAAPTPHRIVSGTVDEERKRATPNLGTPKRR